MTTKKTSFFQFIGNFSCGLPAADADEGVDVPEVELRLCVQVGVEADGTVAEKGRTSFEVTGAVTDDEHNDQHKNKNEHFLLHHEMYVTKCNRKKKT